MKKNLSILLALCLLVALMAGCGKKAEEPAPEEEAAVVVEPPALMTYAEFAAAELDTPVCVETYVQAKQGWWNDAIKVYTQSEDGAYFLYDMPCSEADSEKLMEGTKLRVTGYKSEWNGLVEITEASFEILEGSFVAEPTDVSALLGTDALIEEQNKKVSFTGLTVEPSTDADGNEVAFLYNWDGSGAEGSDSDLYFNVSANGETYTFVVEYYLCNETTEVYEAVRNLQIGDVINAEGFLYWYNGAQPHVTAVTVG